MKKLLFLAAFALLAGTIVSCDNEQEDMSKQSFATDDGLIPIKPPRPPKP